MSDTILAPAPDPDSLCVACGCDAEGCSCDELPRVEISAQEHHDLTSALAESVILERVPRSIRARYRRLALRRLVLLVHGEVAVTDLGIGAMCSFHLLRRQP